MRSRILVAVAALAVLLILIWGVTLAVRSAEHPAVVRLRAPVAAPAPSLAGALKVAVYLSQATGEQWGYSCQMTDQLNHRGLDVVPILDPGTEKDGDLPKLLKTYFPGKPPLVANDAVLLKKFDVIVTPRIWILPDDARAAIEAAVMNGTGLLIRNGLGCMEPGSGPDVSRLSGFVESQFGYDPHPMECEVIGEHPLLGKLTKGKTLMITPNGTWGKLADKSLPLIRVKQMDDFRGNWQGSISSDDLVFYPLYIGELGKGRIVGCQWPAWEPMPKDLMTATGGEFNLRAVKWLARRPLD